MLSSWKALHERKNGEATEPFPVPGRRDALKVGDRTKSHKNMLHYLNPASDWNHALPIGNGRLGAMLSGGAGQERLWLNEDSVWYGVPRDRNNPDAFSNLARIRELIMKGRVREASRLAVLAFSGTPESQSFYQPNAMLYT